MEDQGRLDRLHQEHQEIDAGLRAVRAAGGRAEAGRRLRAALLASRNHFRFEEQFVFPLLDEALQKETLSELGQAWRQRGKAP